MSLQTTIPKLAGIVDEVALQKAITLILADDARLALVPIMPQIKFLADGELLEDVLWQLPRSAFTLTADGWTVNTQTTPNQPVGAGILVEMPEADSDSPKVSGPPLTWKVPIVAFQELNANWLPGTGIGITSGQLCQICLDVCQNLYVFGYGAFTVETAAIKPATDWTSLKPGIEAHRLLLTATVGRTQTPRSAPVVIAIAAGVATLTCADPSAQILYTTDFTEPVASNPNASQCVSGFQLNVASGTIVKAATKTAGKTLSPIVGAVAP
ncbi:MAG: chitobiase/beta-hexosaminidase C-terminal domain-containing protein [Patescibacteria group bacterium]|nr:chitobiase/beta-hexosaminidase C-terminal domain-containing protein [Patescibacteria group bacterium]